MITLEEYKLELLSSYTNEEEKEKRKEFLNRIYNDRYLERIISDTYSLIKDIYNTKYLEENKSTFDLNEEEPFDDISLDPSTKTISDKIFIDKEERYISELILKKVLKGINIEIIESINTANQTPSYKIEISSFPTNMLEIKENIFGESKTLK